MLKCISQQFKMFELKKIPRGQNAQENWLVCAASASLSGENSQRVVSLECLESPSVGAVEPQVMQVDSKVR